jgi:hypothetical protein
MTNGNYKSIKDLISRLLRNPLMSDLNKSDIGSYIADALRLIEAPMAYEEKVATITIEDYRGELPCDIIYIQQTQKLKTALNEAIPESSYNRTYGYLPMRYATDHFHTALHADTSPDLQKAGYTETGYDLTYKVQSNYIYTSFREGVVRMSYKGLALDKEGYPMIPDNIKVEKALENHVMYEYLRILWMLGKIPDKVYRDVSTERDWYIGAAGTSLQMQSIDQAEAMKAALTRTILKPLQHGSGFKDLGTQEYLNKGSI